MKKLVLIFLAVLLIYSVVGQSKAITSEYFEVMIGTKFNNQLQVVQNKDGLLTGNELYYSIKPLKELSNINEVQITVRTGEQEIQSEKFGVYKKKLARPINPILITKKGIYVVEVSANSKILSRDFFNVK